MTTIEVGKAYTYAPNPDWGEPWSTPGIIQIISLSDRGIAEYEVIDGMSDELTSRNFYVDSAFAECLLPDNEYNRLLNADPEDFEISFDELMGGRFN